MTKRQQCPLRSDCSVEAVEDFEQSNSRQFFRMVFCKTHEKNHHETLRVVGYFPLESDGHEGKFIPGCVGDVREVARQA